MTAQRHETHMVEPWTVTLDGGNATGRPPLDGEGILTHFETEHGPIVGPFLVVDVLFCEGFRFRAPAWIGRASPEGAWLWDMPGAPHDGTDPPGFTALLPRDVPLALHSAEDRHARFTMRWTATGRLEVAFSAP